MSKKDVKLREHQLYTVYPEVRRELFRENKIDPTYRSRARKIRNFSRLFYLPAMAQKLLFEKQIRRIDLEGQAPVFVLGLWRSGTTHLHYLLARDRQFGYMNNHQAFAFNLCLLSFKKLNRILNVFVPKHRPQDNVKLDLEEPAEEEQPFSTISSHSSIHSFFFPKNQDYFKKYHLFQGCTAEEKEGWKRDYYFVLQNVARYSRKRRLMLKNPHNTGRVKELLELFPDARFIYLHRDPATVFQSMRRLYEKTISSQFLQECEKEEIDRIIVENNQAIMEKYLAERSLIPKGQLVEIAFEDLEKDPKISMLNIYHELGITGFDKAWPAMSTYLDSVKNYQKNKYTSLTQEETELLEKHWGPSYERFTRL